MKKLDLIKPSYSSYEEKERVGLINGEIILKAFLGKKPLVELTKYTRVRIRGMLRTFFENNGIDNRNNYYGFYTMRVIQRKLKENNMFFKDKTWFQID